MPKLREGIPAGMANGKPEILQPAVRDVGAVQPAGVAAWKPAAERGQPGGVNGAAA